MNIKTAVVFRIKELCAQRGITVHYLAYESGITPSTIYNMLAPKQKGIGIVTIKKICDGFDITISAFFDTEMFKNLEQEIC